jgi:hypothetical protein
MVPHSAFNALPFPVRKFIKYVLKGTVWLEVVSFDRSLLKVEAPRFSTDFNHHLSCMRPFKFLRHLVEALENNRMIAMSDMYIYSAIFKLTRTQKQTWKWT